jgi:hypothetical protein
MNTPVAITPELVARARIAMRAIIAARGPHKGQIKSRAPAMSTDAYAAWQGAMLAINPYKVSIGGCLFMTPDQRAIMDFVHRVYESTPGAAMLDHDRETLENLGAW